MVFLYNVASHRSWEGFQLFPGRVAPTSMRLSMSDVHRVLTLSLNQEVVFLHHSLNFNGNIFTFTKQILLCISTFLMTTEQLLLISLCLFVQTLFFAIHYLWMLSSLFNSLLIILKFQIEKKTKKVSQKNSDVIK